MLQAVNSLSQFYATILQLDASLHYYTDIVHHSPCIQNVESILRMFYYSWSMEYDTTGSHTGCEVNLTRRSQELLMLSYVTLCWRVMNVELVLTNCKNCNQCLKGHRSLGLLFQGAICLFVGQVRSPHNSDHMSPSSQVSGNFPKGYSLWEVDW